MPAKVGGHALLVRAEGRLVLVLGNFFQDHQLLRVEIRLPQGRPQDVAQQFRRLVLVLRQKRREVHGLLFARVGVGVRADLVQFAVHVGRAPLGGALKGHVLQEMADAVDVVGFVARAGLGKEAQRGRIRVRGALCDHFQSVA